MLSQLQQLDSLFCSFCCSASCIAVHPLAHTRISVCSARHVVGSRSAVTTRWQELVKSDGACWVSRYSALEVLFDTLQYHGSAFTPEFWTRIFDSVLLSIFDHVRAEVPPPLFPRAPRLLPQEPLEQTTNSLSDITAGTVRQPIALGTA